MQQKANKHKLKKQQHKYARDKCIVTKLYKSIKRFYISTQ